MNTYASYADRAPGLVSGRSRLAIFLAVVAVHALLVSLPYLRSLRPTPVKENMFKVKLGSDKPSHDVNVGKPERVRPTGKPATPAPAEPKFTPPKPRPKPKSEPKLTSVKPKPRPSVEPKIDTSAASSRHDSSRTPDRKSASTRNTARQGGSNFNNTVPIGSRNVGQRLGRPDNRTPQGGLTEAEEAYYNRLKKILDLKWVEPSRTHLGDQRPQTTIELDIAADGRVIGARIVNPSGIPAMDDSIRRLLSVLDRVPIPPDGAMLIHVNMKVQ